MRSTTDFLGLVAYLTVMYGRLPDRDLLNAAYMGTGQEPEQPRPRLTLVEAAPPPALEEPKDTTAAAA